jgi:hypothetical protein
VKFTQTSPGGANQTPSAPLSRTRKLEIQIDANGVYQEPRLLTEVSDGNKAKFSHYRDGNFFYVVKVQDEA